MNPESTNKTLVGNGQIVTSKEPDQHHPVNLKGDEKEPTQITDGSAPASALSTVDWNSFFLTEPSVKFGS